MLLHGGCPELINLLLREGADPAVKSISGSSGVSRAKQNLLSGRCNEDTRAIFQHIVELGADEHPSTAIHDSILGINGIDIDQAIEMEPQSLNFLDAMGYTPLHWAIRLDNNRALDALLRANADTNALEFWLSTPLHTAVRRAGLYAVKQLLNKGSDPSARDMDGQTPLHDALSLNFAEAQLGSREIVKLLLEHGSDPNAIDKLKKQSPLSWCLSHLQHDVETVEANIDALITAGADIEQRDKFGRSPLLNGIGGAREPRILGALLSRGARLDIINDFRQTVLHLVAMWGGLDIIQYFTTLTGRLMDMDTEGQDVYAYTPLDWMAFRASYTPDALLEQSLYDMKTATDEEVTAFKALIHEIRDVQRRERILEESIGIRSLWVE